MEHRWGERLAVHLTVELCTGSSPPVEGYMENVSSSGAFVRTGGQGPPRGPVEVILRNAAAEARTRAHPASARLPAYVVRETRTGVGIEWCEFAPRAVRELLIRDRRSGARTRARAQRSGAYFSRGPNSVMPSRVQPAGAGPPVLDDAARR